MKMGKNLLARKQTIYMLIQCSILIILVGCSSEEKEQISIDTIGVVQFTNEQMETKNCNILEKSISQRTKDVTLFVVEYLYKIDETENSYNYGYYLKEKDGNFLILDEGENVNKSILE